MHLLRVRVCVGDVFAVKRSFVLQAPQSDSPPPIPSIRPAVPLKSCKGPSSIPRGKGVAISPLLAALALNLMSSAQMSLHCREKIDFSLQNTPYFPAMKPHRSKGYSDTVTEFEEGAENLILIALDAAGTQGNCSLVS